MKRARIDLRVDEKTKVKWAEEAEARGIEVSEAIRRAMPMYFAAVPRKRRQRRPSGAV